MSNRFPTRFELKCSGCSFFIAQILLLFGIFMYSIDYDVYSVTTEEEVVKLHNLLSSPSHRTEIEIGVTAVWISFPFFLIGLFGIKKLITAVHQNTAGEMFVFSAIQSYIIFITIICIIVPALSLSTVAFEWSFHEYTPEPDFIPTGYYIQLYLVVFNNEIVDCVTIADAVFMISLCILPRFVLKDSATFKKLKAIMDADLPECLRNMQNCLKCFWILHVAFAISLFVVFCIVLFEFADGGFFAPSGKSKFLIIWSFFLKILMGIRIAALGFSKKYDAMKQVFVDEGVSMLSGQEHEQNYAMDQIALGTEDKKENEDQDDEL